MRKKDDPPEKLSQEDQDIWDDFVGQNKAQENNEEDFEKLLNENVAREKEETVKSAPQENLSSSSIPAPEQKKSFHPPQLDKRTEEKLRKGKIQIEGRLDLHGLNQNQAYEKLKVFIEHSVHQKKRCLLVITGKGKSRIDSGHVIEPERGVLKEKLPQWLSENSFARHILKSIPAHIKDGGSGAFYIYLKRQR